MLYNALARYNTTTYTTVLIEPIGMEVPMVDQEVLTDATPTTTISDSHFKNMSADEVDALASGRTSTNTNEQTRWGVKVLRDELQV